MMDFLKDKARELEHLLLKETDNDERINKIIQQYVVELYKTHKQNPQEMFKQYIQAIEVQLELLQIPYKTILPEYYKSENK